MTEQREIISGKRKSSPICGTASSISVDSRIVERKIFWITFTMLGLVADLVLPLWWALGATIPHLLRELVGGLP